MKVLKVVPHCFPAWAYGGTPRIVYEVSRRLVQRGHSVTVLTTDTLDQENRIAFDESPRYIEGIRVFYLRNLSNWLAWNHNFSSSLGLIPVARGELGSHDIVHMHEFRTWENVVAHRHALRKRVPYVLSAHGSALRIVAKRRLKQAYDWFFGYRLLHGAELLVASSQGEVEDYRAVLDEVGSGASARKAVVIPNGVDPDDFRDLPAREEFRSRHKIGTSDKIILFLGRLHPMKRLPLLLEPFIDLSRKDDALRLVLAGPDEGEGARLRAMSLEAGLGQKVLFVGLLEGRDRLAALCSADLSVLPSYSEGLPLGVLEACASGLPVVVTRGCNIPEVEEYQAGFVVGDSREELQTAMQRILENPGLQRMLSAHARKMVLDRFTWDQVVAQLEEVYREVIAERERPRNLLGR